MDRQSTIRLLNETFNQNFELEKFIKFIKELFNKFPVTQKSWNVWKEYQKYIESYQLLGSYKDNSKKIIDVLIVKLKRTSSRDRARTMQRNFIAKYLGNEQKDAALVAFYGDDPEDWRFSFVKMEYNLVKDESGKVKPVKELTPAKRYSFLVGVNEPNHTCRSQFLKLVMEEEVNPSLLEIEQAFSIDNVTKEFFEKYKELYLELKESLEKVLKKDKNAQKEFEEKNILTVNFAKKLLGQIVFIYFLQKKGWLGVDVNGKWGDGPKDFMRRLFGDKNEGIKPLVQYKNFFNEILEPLFYEALSTDRSADDHYYRLFKCKIPFLNGGLFEPINEYNWSRTDILLDNSIFDRILSTFDRFNFTVKEDEPLEKEVAVDPEMLGKVFENLLEVKDRKSKGAFYTPREIVHYMCQQSLINYLETKISIPRKDIEKFIQLGDLVLNMLIKEQEMIKEYGRSYNINEEYTLPTTIKENYEEIDKLLQDVRIVDPAVGSGAFLVGMMNEIIRARSILSIFSEKEHKDYDLKRKVIEGCLYGVDIEPSAVEITKLRFWLSLIVDELDMRNIQPLPNLDHKIMCGNSLLEEFEGVKLFDERLLGEVKKDYSTELSRLKNEEDRLKKELQTRKCDKKRHNQIVRKLKKISLEKLELQSGKEEGSKQVSLNDALKQRIKESQRKLKELKQLQKQFFNEQNRKRKKQLREDIERLEWELIEETLKEQGNLEAMHKLRQYKKNKSKPFFLWKLYFAEIFQRENPGFDIVIANPPYFPITSLPKDIKKSLFEDNPEISGSFAGKTDVYSFFILKSLKQLIRKNGQLSYIIPKTILSNMSFSKLREHILNYYKIDELVDLEKVFEQVTGTMTYLLIFIKNKRPQNNYNLTINNMEIGGRIESSIINIKDLDRPPFYIWILSKDKILLLNRIEEDSDLLKQNYITKNAICTGNNSKFLSNEKKNDSYKLIFVAKDISKYHIKRPSHFVYYKPNLLHRPREPWIFEGPKILTQMIRGLNTTYRLICALDYSNKLALNNINIIRKRYDDSDIEFLLGLINSKLINYYFKNLITDVNIKTVYLDIIPIKKGKTNHKKQINKLVNQILKITKDEDCLDNLDKQAKVKELEKEIDRLVYKLYKLTPKEIKVIKDFHKKKEKGSIKSL